MGRILPIVADCQPESGEAPNQTLLDHADRPARGPGAETAAGFSSRLVKASTGRTPHHNAMRHLWIS